MSKLIFVQPDGSARELQAEPGHSVMETAIENNIDGIVGECGGSMSCATCHVFLDDETFARIEGPGEVEIEMLEFAAVPRQRTSRLSCQVKVEDELDGATISIPERQY